MTAPELSAQERETVERHDIIVEIYDGIALSMKCIPCRSRIAIRPERSASELSELNDLAREHVEAVARLDHGTTP